MHAKRCMLGELHRNRWDGSGAGAGNRVRTGDLLITNQLLYQLSYAGVLLWNNGYCSGSVTIGHLFCTVLGGSQADPLEF